MVVRRRGEEGYRCLARARYRRGRLFVRLLIRFPAAIHCSCSALLAISPLGRGFLTGAIKSVNDLPEDDIRRHLTRFGEDYIKHNLKLVEELKAIAAKKGCTPGQLSIAWVGSLGPKVIPLPGSSCVP